MDELEEYEAFARLLKQGRNIAEIAQTFGVTELFVKQRFALANLHSKIKDAYLCVPKIRFGVDAASGRRKLAS
jgi:ParB family chromosome partitioning protein